ncbi:hypothetical protein HOD08_00465 [bacterium]|nr:hypothetical protein [bacterium]
MFDNNGNDPEEKKCFTCGFWADLFGKNARITKAIVAILIGCLLVVKTYAILLYVLLLFVGAALIAYGVLLLKGSDPNEYLSKLWKLFDRQ